MAKNVFFSWQSDTQNKVGRTFLKEALVEVCSDINSETSLEEALRDVAVDCDTQGVAGQPPIAQTIFNKIDKAAVFVADVTFTGKRLDDRPTPNPNVLIEYGWAQKSLTSERVICVMNTAYGKPNSEDLPFDLAHLRWPITYDLPVDATTTYREQEKKKLKKTLKEAISLCLKTVPSSEVIPQPKFQAAQPKDGKAYFRDSKEPIGFQDDRLGDNNKEVFLTRGPAMWLRVMPTINQQKKLPTRELRKIAMKNSYLMPLISPSGGYSYLRASDGVGMYRTKGNNTDERHLNIDSVAFAFMTGEVWSIETSLLSYDKGRLFMTDIEQSFVEGMKRYTQFLKELGIDDPYHWKVGIIGIKGRQLSYPPPPQKQWLENRGPICASDLIEAEGTIEVKQSVTTILLPFFREIFEACGVERPDYLPQ